MGRGDAAAGLTDWPTSRGPGSGWHVIGAGRGAFKGKPATPCLGP